jgi:hypothetical protein
VHARAGIPKAASPVSRALVRAGCPPSEPITGIWPVTTSSPGPTICTTLRPNVVGGNSEQPEQDVLGADVVVPERPRLVLGEDDDLASPLREPLEHSSRG